MMSSIFGGRDPFFTRPFQNSSESSMLHPRTLSDDSLQQVAKPNGPFIQEIDMDDEGEVGIEPPEEDGDINGWEKGDRTHANRDPLVEHPEDHTDDYNKNKGVSKDTAHKMEDTKLEGTQSKTQSLSYRRVTYGGINGAYYTAATTRRTGSDGMVLEESKQADKTTGQATHRVSRGINDKGHSLTRKLASDGRVDTTQTLHNLEEDELAGFEQIWNGNADRHIPGWTTGYENAGTGNSLLTNWDTGFRYPFSSGPRPNSSTTQSGKPKKVVRINIE